MQYKIIIIILFCCIKIYSQNKTIQGYVYDSVSGEPIPLIYVKLNKTTAQSDLDGKFKMVIDKPLNEKSKQYLYFEMNNYFAKDSMLLDKSVDLKKIKMYLKKSGVELKGEPPVELPIKLIEK